MYTCECVDYANGHICKHLHGIHCLRMKSQTTTTCDNDTLSDIIGKFVYHNIILILRYDTDFKENEEKASLTEVDGKVVLPTNTPIVQGRFNWPY